jgi:hypothetical protein
MATRDAGRRRGRAWRPRPGGMPKPSLRDTLRPDYVAETADEASADQLARWARWRGATVQERAETLAALLDLVSAMGRFPPKRDQFPGWKTIVERRHAKTGLR